MQKKRRQTNIPAEQSSGEPPVPGGEVETEHSREERGSNVHSVTAPLMSNVSIGINSIPKSGTSSSTANYSTITGELIGATIFGKESIGLETGERGAGRVTEAEDFNNKNNSRDGSSEAHEAPPLHVRTLLLLGLFHQLKISVSYRVGHAEAEAAPLSVTASNRPSQDRKEAWKKQQNFLGCLQNAFMLPRLMNRKLTYWWRLAVSPASSHELPSVELSRAWEPAYRTRAR